ncbi:TPA: toprim domain-containing protein [Streptococcus suis]|uniref:DUF3991 domain-containing protein n=1 Tax=Streptococcus suis TaxID=1307 RepID=UPI00211C6BB3|nr:DUF3991 domain-containing protein [Streptococcus suis]UUM59098.1 toprim domain-containing protein [Streptococcus suis]HEL1546114.1 toprim domain-containing protein [Streptococcus suis]HEL1551313.1 toprim domain-containing protein [Streptococcus suis]HEL1552631.1 toprim domain-containing protein [Streptococcus suis]HEL2327709.1 toprim domain-containing protein [Streptococcus suis]
MSIDELKKKSILDVAASLGVPLRRIGSNLYEHEEHDSFRVFADTNTFKWFSRDVQGDVINFVELIKNVPTNEALYYLQHGDFKPVQVQEIKQEPFRYFLKPYERADFREARQYLTKERKLSDDTIDFFHARGVLAEAVKKTNAYYEPVIVFKYLDNAGTLNGASLQGIRENHSLYERGRLKQIVKNSDGMMGLSVSIGQPKRLVFLEAPIDLMSYYEMNKDKLSDVRLVAMEGLKEATISRYTLELAGDLMGKDNWLEKIEPSKRKITLEALAKTTKFFEKHPDLITLAVDNDQAGRDFIDKLQDKGLPIVVDLPPLLDGAEKSDWNEVLKVQKSEQVLRSPASSLNDLIAEAKEELQDSVNPGMKQVYEYSEKVAPLFEKPGIDQTKFAFLLANMENNAVYNHYAIQEDYVEEMMAVTKLYVEFQGRKTAMLDAAVERELLADKETFLRQYAQDFIKNELQTPQSINL